MDANQIKEQLQAIKDAVPAGVWEEALALFAAEEGPTRTLSDEHKARMADEKPKRTLTEEHKAKMMAGRAATKASVVAELSKPTDAYHGEKPKRVLSEEHKAKMMAGRAATKASVVAELSKPTHASHNGGFSLRRKRSRRTRRLR